MRSRGRSRAPEPAARCLPIPLRPRPRPQPGLSDEIRTTALLAAPLVGGHVSTGLIGFVDNVLAGHHGTTTLASVTIGTALWWLPMMVPIGTLLSVPPSVSQLDGAGRRGEIGALFRQALWLALGLGVLLFAFLTLHPAWRWAPMGIAPEIIPGVTDFPARHPLGRAGADAVLQHALPQRRPALDAADDGAQRRRPAGAGAGGLRADLRPPSVFRNLAPADSAWPRRSCCGCRRSASRSCCGARAASPTCKLFERFDAPDWPRDPRPARHRPADRRDGPDGGRPVHRHRAADRAAGRGAGGGAPDRHQPGGAVLHGADGRWRRRPRCASAMRWVAATSTACAAPPGPATPSCWARSCCRASCC